MVYEGKYIKRTKMSNEILKYECQRIVEFCLAINRHQVLHHEKLPEFIEAKFSITISFPYINKY